VYLKKIWFRLDCKFTRQNYRKLKSRHKRNKTESSKLDMKKIEKEYKKLLDTSIINHRKEMWQKMKELRSKNSKEYWKILNSGCRKKQSNISISSLFNLKKLNAKTFVDINLAWNVVRNSKKHCIKMSQEL
jgi:tRNA nucleotidyltransferase/poly(A) polymerase